MIPPGVLAGDFNVGWLIKKCFDFRLEICPGYPLYPRFGLTHPR